jgi:hypothetical protein
MTEGIKTLIYLGVALLVALVAFMSRPRIEEFKVSELENKALFDKFDDPAKADRMEIVRYDEALGTLDQFRVARDKASGAWTLPSHGGYPADAETRVRDAALLLVDLQVLGIASTVSGDHRMFGVIEPDKDKLKVGDEGVGLLVRFEDGKGQDLASLIIGKKVKGADDQRFVREPKKDVVYTVRIDPDKLSTKFQDWIEKDLFKDLKGWDVEHVALKNYTVSLQPPNRVLIDKKFDLAADFKDSEWKLRELTKYSQGEGAVVALSDQEELNKEKLNDLKTAVDELEIADVRRKPKGLGADLKAGEGYAKDDEGVVDLAKHGFYMVPTANNEIELLSANGEVSVGTKDGVEYVLRFGENDEGGEGAEGEGQNRYLFVTTRVDMSKFPQPELQPLPELPTGAKPEAAKDAKPEAEAKPEATPEAKPEATPEAKPEATPEAKPEATPEAKPEATPEAKPEATPEAKPAETASETAKPTASDEPPAQEPAKPEAEAKIEAEVKPEAKPEGEAKPTTEAKPDEAADAKTEAKPEAKADTEAQESEIEKERERINKENQRKIDERNDKIKKAKDTVAKENTRFADWYYLVSDTTFKKIQLGLDDVVKKKESKDGEPVGDGVDAFRQLQSEGLKKE